MKLSQKFLDLIELTCAPALVGLSNSEIYQILSSKNDPQNKRNFQLKSFVGWKSAQMKNLELQMAIQSDKEFVERDPSRIYTFRNLQRLMDSIVWVHYGNTSDMKTIYQPEPVIADLKNHNIESHIAIANESNKKEDEFWLISDLTSGFKSGDFFTCKAGGARGFVEAKTGRVNTAIHKLLFEGDQKDLLSIVNVDNESSVKKQMKRTLGQVQRAMETQKALRNETHEDSNFPGIQKNIVVYDRPMEGFGDVVNRMLELPNEECVELVEDCLFVGVRDIKGGSKTPHSLFLQTISDKFGENIVGPSCDIGLYLNGTSFTKPIYLQPFSKNAIHQLVGREKGLHLYLSLHRFADKFRTENISMDILSGGEMRRLYSQHREYSSKHQGHILRVRDNQAKAEGLLSDGLLQKMFSELFLPNELLKANLMMIRQLFADTTEE